jgi:hypothetical protein
MDELIEGRRLLVRRMSPHMTHNRHSTEPGYRSPRLSGMPQSVGSRGAPPTLVIIGWAVPVSRFIGERAQTLLHQFSLGEVDERDHHAVDLSSTVR